MKKFRITVNGKAYEVEAEIISDLKPSTATPANSESARIHAGEAAPAPKKVVHAPAGAGDVISPLAGKVVSIDAKEGQTVAEGEKVLTLEAMKMNTFVIAPCAGTIKGILVNVGQAVEEGMVLAKLD